MHRLIKLSFPVIVILLCTGCFYFFGAKTATLDITDLSLKSVDTLQVNINAMRGPHTVEVKITGETDSKFMINEMMMGPGKVDTILDKGDYFGTMYPIRYTPLEAKKGHLKVEATFFY